MHFLLNFPFNFSHFTPKAFVLPKAFDNSKKKCLSYWLKNLSEKQKTFLNSGDQAFARFSDEFGTNSSILSTKWKKWIKIPKKILRIARTLQVYKHFL